MAGRSRVFHGIGASPGIAIGRVFVLDRRQVRVPRYHIEADQVDYEVQRLDSAVEESVGQLEAIRSRFVDDGMDHQAILEAHEMMLGDKALRDEACELIRGDLLNAEWAVSRVIGRLRGLFERVTDTYFRERRGDIDFVGERILRNLVGQAADLSDIGHIEDGTIIVAHDLSPVDTALLSRQRVTAFVTEVGGKTSHTSIVARSLEVPAVVGANGILDAAGGGDLIVVDGLDGTVRIRPTRAQVERGRERSHAFQRLNLELLEAKALPATTLDGRNLGIAGNIELPSEIATVLSRGGEGIGLYRTEFMYLGRSEAPREEDHYRTYCRLFDEVGEREVTVRTLDLGGEKIFGAMPRDTEPNPALGLRAIRYCLRHPEVFKDQVAGLLRAAVNGNLRVMLPMISSVDELHAAKELIAEVVDRLTRQGKEHRSDVPIGIMIEVPSSALTADHLARECDFFAIGTNDLLQYLLAIDRTNERVDYLYHPLYPAVLRVLRMVVDAARETATPVSVCGEMAGDTDHTAVLLGLGVQDLSMNAGSIPRIKRLVRELRQADCEAMLEEAFTLTTYTEVAALVRDFMHSKAPRRLYGGES
jgi:phosphotransferase system enzyme I (PtsI)